MNFFTKLSIIVAILSTVGSQYCMPFYRPIPARIQTGVPAGTPGAHASNNMPAIALPTRPTGIPRPVHHTPAHSRRPSRFPALSARATHTTATPTPSKFDAPRGIRRHVPKKPSTHRSRQEDKKAVELSALRPDDTKTQSPMTEYEFLSKLDGLTDSIHRALSLYSKKSQEFDTAIDGANNQIIDLVQKQRDILTTILEKNPILLSSALEGIVKFARPRLARILLAIITIDEKQQIARPDFERNFATLKASHRPHRRA